MNSYNFSTHSLRLDVANQDIEVRNISEGLPGSLVGTFAIDADQNWLKIWRDGDQIKLDRTSEPNNYDTYTLDGGDFQVNQDGGILTIDIRDPTRSQEPFTFPLDNSSHYILLRMDNAGDLHLYYND